MTISSTIAWLLALFLPLQVFTGLYLDIRGPLHFHIQHHDEHDHDHADDAAQRHDEHDGHVAHAHTLAEHHHHAALDASVVLVDENVDKPFVEDELKPGWSSAMFLALPADVVSFRPHVHAGRLRPDRSSAFKTRAPKRLERPPRILPA